MRTHARTFVSLFVLASATTLSTTNATFNAPLINAMISKRGVSDPNEMETFLALTAGSSILSSDNPSRDSYPFDG